MSPRVTATLIAVVFIIVLVLSSIFTVDETEQALVLRFGEPREQHTTPGLKVKTPFVEQVVFYDDRVLDLDPSAEEVILLDQKRIVVDTFLRYRISDPLRFFQALRTESAAANRLEVALNSALRDVLGSVNLTDILSDKRTEIMNDIRERVDRQAGEQNLGLEIVDVRIRQADLPEGATKAVFDRMKSERAREAAQLRAEGEELKREITAIANRDRTIILAEAQRQAQELRGAGDRESLTITGRAYAAAPEFYAFYRSLEAYRTALQDGQTSLILKPEGEFFRFFGGENRGMVPPPLAEGASAPVAQPSAAPQSGAATVPAPAAPMAGAAPDPDPAPSPPRPDVALPAPQTAPIEGATGSHPERQAAPDVPAAPEVPAAPAAPAAPAE